MTLMEVIIVATRNQWHCRGDSLEIKNHKFIFEVNNESDEEQILNKQPWLILGNTLLIQEINEENFMEEIESYLVPIWVTFSGLPVDYAS